MGEDGEGGSTVREKHHDSPTSRSWSPLFWWWLFEESPQNATISQKPVHTLHKEPPRSNRDRYRNGNRGSKRLRCPEDRGQDLGDLRRPENSGHGLLLRILRRCHLLAVVSMVR